MAVRLLNVELSKFRLVGLAGGDQLASISLPGFGWKGRLTFSRVAHALRQILQVHQQFVDVVVPVRDSFRPWDRLSRRPSRAGANVGGQTICGVMVSVQMRQVLP